MNGIIYTIIFVALAGALLIVILLLKNLLMPESRQVTNEKENLDKNMKDLLIVEEKDEKISIEDEVGRDDLLGK